MIQNSVSISDAKAYTSNLSVDSGVGEFQSGVAPSQCQTFVDVPSQLNATMLNLPAIDIPNNASISHISSVALHDSTDITIGNKMLYNGPVTINQYGIERPSKRRKTYTFKIKVIILAAVIVLISIVATILSLHFKHGEPDNSVINIDNDDTPLVLVSREEWRAKPATADLDDLIVPVSLVIIQHTVQASCDTLVTCSLLVRQAQTLHINSNSIGDDIGYNFLVGGDGAAYEGRGWNKIGAHTRSYNSRSIGVAFIGDFRAEAPTNAQIVALLKLLRDGVQNGKLSGNYTLIGANQVENTESPGKMLFQILTKLPHWSDGFD